MNLYDKAYPFKKFTKTLTHYSQRDHSIIRYSTVHAK
jgi:hypothetical protein